MIKLIIGVFILFYLKYQNLFYNTVSLFTNCYLVKTFGFGPIPLHKKQSQNKCALVSSCIAQKSHKTVGASLHLNKHLLFGIIHIKF